MKEVIVTKVFIDKTDLTRRFSPGQSVAFDDERADSIISMGLARLAEPPSKTESIVQGKDADVEKSAAQSTEASPAAEPQPKATKRKKK